MIPLKDKIIVDFSGGVRGDKSDFQKADNELVSCVNFDILKQGGLQKRYGSHQFGTTQTANFSVRNSFYFEYWAAGVPTRFQLINNGASSGNTVYKIVGSRTTNTLTPASTSITVTDSTQFAASGTVEIEGDVISYTGNAGNTFTGVTGITFNHATAQAIHQNVALTGSQPDATENLYYAALNGLVFIQGYNGAKTFDGTTLTDVGDADEPNAIFATTYRQKIFCVDSQLMGNKVYFSNPGDPTAWTANDDFTVENNYGGAITGLTASITDQLYIWKTNSFFAYNEVTLKERSNRVGAYNHFVARELDGIVYTFCPNGVFATNGGEHVRISDPVKEYIEDFQPLTSDDRTVRNTYATIFDNKYFLFLGTVFNPEVASNTMLVYDILTKAWTVDRLTIPDGSLSSLNALSPFHYGGGTIQGRPGLFAGTNTGGFYRFYSKKYNDSSGILHNTNAPASDVYLDFVSNTGSTVSGEMQTKLYDLGSLSEKQFGYLRVLTEGKGFFVSYQIETEKGLSEWISLGEVTKTNQRFRLRESGYRIAIKITHTDNNSAPILNGIAFEDCGIKEDKR